MVPAAGQGILCIQGRAGEDNTFLQGFFDEEARQCALCERAFVAYLNGSCALPIGACAEIIDERRMRLLGLYFDEETKIYRKMGLTGERKNPEELGKALARELKRACSE